LIPIINLIPVFGIEHNSFHIKDLKPIYGSNTKALVQYHSSFIDLIIQNKIESLASKFLSSTTNNKLETKETKIPCSQQLDS
jgi:hypothetical protein